MTIGPLDGLRRPELVVAPDDVINWHIFDGMQTGAGSNWPRYIQYEGNNTTLFDWMRDRETEEVHFVPRDNIDLDASEVQLDGLSLSPGGHRIRMTLPRTLKRLSIMGDPKLVAFDLPLGATWPDIHLSDNGVLASIDGLPSLTGVRSLGIRNTVLGTPFDCRSLLSLRNLDHLRLYGAAAHLEALAALPLKGLELRFVPDLGGLPDLTTWPGLGYFIAWNVDEGVGKTLRKAADQLARQLGEDGTSQVSKLRSRQWFIEECGLPFGGWSSKNEKAASKAYKAASKRLRAATIKDEARAAVTVFVDVVNRLSGIETSERDDAGDAVAMLAAVRPDLIGVEEALAWFDETRDF
ncbi:hypothetical protein [Rhizobium sp. BR 315]|uniref:hypothetical protein n=1 Tax=Rhizobium sp. BR 315 TaxID=3040014 RepID=UPI003D355A60